MITLPLETIKEFTKSSSVEQNMAQEISRNLEAASKTLLSPYYSENYKSFCMFALGTRGREEIHISYVTASPPYSGMVTMKVN